MSELTKQWYVAGFCFIPEMVEARQAGLLDDEMRCKLRTDFRQRQPELIKEFRAAITAADPGAEQQEVTCAKTKNKAVFFKTDNANLLTELYQDAHYLIEPVDDERKEELVALWSNPAQRQPG